MKTKKVLLYLFPILLFFSQTVFSQQGWIWQNPGPSDETIVSAYYLNSNTIYALGKCGTFFSSFDNGITWTQKNILPPASSVGDLYGELSVINASTVYTYSEARPLGYPFLIVRRIHKSTDGGNHWASAIYDSTTLSGNTFLYRKIKFINANTGFDYDYRAYYKSAKRTTDGGLTWSKLQIGTADSLSSVFFINENTGWVTSPRGKVYKTTDGSASWTGYNALENSNSFFKIYFINNNTGWAFRNSFLKTTDGGVSFTQVSPILSIIEDFLFVDANTGYAVKSTGEVLRTTNGGANWNTLSTKMPAHFLNSSTAVAGGEFVSVSTDGGLSWTSRAHSVSSNSLEDIYFHDENYGWAVGMNTILKTSDGGAHWISDPAAVLHNTAVRFVNQNTGVVGTFGGIIRTTNFGASWNNVTGSAYSTYSFYRLRKTSANTLYALASWQQTDSTFIFKSTDAGASWELKTAPPRAQEFHFVNDYLGYAMSTGLTYKTTDGAATWSLAANKSWKNLFFLNENTGWYSDSGTVYRTSNGGASWITRYSSYGSVTYDMKFFDLNTGYRTVREGTPGSYQMQKTTDAGETFSNMNFYIDSRKLYKMSFVNQNTGWVCGDGGLIIKTSSGGSISVQQISSVVPDNFSLMQNYPNPFNPATVIRYQLSAAGTVSLKVFDLLGKEVASLVNEKQSAGSYAVSFNSGEFNLTSGIYFYTLSTGDFKETRKMVLVK